MNNRNLGTSLVSVVCAMAWGCGAADETRVSPEGSVGGSTEEGSASRGVRLPAPGRPYEFEEVYPVERTEPSRAELVDVIAWKSERIEFWDVGELGEPTILLTRLGHVAEGDVLTLLEQQAEFTVTAAELWHVVTGKHDVPEALVRAHERTAVAEGRPVAYQEFDLSSVKKVVFDFNAMFPLTQANTCWAGSSTVQADVGVTRGRPQSTVCTSGFPVNLSPPGSSVRFVPVTSSSTCPATLGSKFGIRAGVFNAAFNASTSPETAQICYDSGSRFGWQCLASVLLPVASYYVSELPAASFEQRFGVGVSSASALGTRLVYGAASLRSGPRGFETTRCENGPAPTPIRI